MRVQILYTAYDQAGQRPHVERTVRMLREAGLTQRQVGCYVLVGQEGDTREGAEARLEWVFETGGTPFAMYFRPPEDRRRRIPRAWSRLVRRWTRPAVIFSARRGAPVGAGAQLVLRSEAPLRRVVGEV